MKYLYKYPQREYPYVDLIETNRRRSRNDFEYDLIDTGIFDDDRYFDIFVEYAKESPNDILVRITVCNRGPDAARLHVLPTRRLKIRSMVGLLPLCASMIFEPDQVKLPKLAELVQLFRERYPEVLAQISPTADGYVGYGGRRLLSPLSKDRLERVLGYLLDENEFLGPYGIRSLSRYHKDHPFVFDFGGHHYDVSYLPAESDTGMFGGNSNWRGPIWMPVNALIVRGLLNLYGFYGDELRSSVLRDRATG
jgi:Glycosyl hydrolase family 63 C-terminal domain